ncbi:FG-GAP repeat domain-containing protein [Cohnella terricola]|uniref:VCBS repeat-containing protein n=1 Tax=Cohnella terricola TaxID=1289167 RepID=A0A559JNB2_9BACL|nr:VCBS repeat-containing protein [Cohnella terricola]TVY01372.1 hypothetical protein FPZ45_09555 [Cohnella terricola]
MAYRWGYPISAGMLALSVMLMGACSMAGERAQESAGFAAEESGMVNALSEENGVRSSLPERLQLELDKLGNPTDDMSAWLQAFAAEDNPGEFPVNVIRTDLNGDGVADEWVSVFYENVKAQNGLETHRAYGVVVAYKDGKFDLQSFPFSEEYYGRAEVFAVEDLTNDGKPEIVWTARSVGAHTVMSVFTASSWTEGKLEPIEGNAPIADLSAAEVRDGRLMVTGGLIDSVGAGPWQREYTATYSVTDHALKLEDRVYAESLTPYHRLIDGLWAEALGHPERALKNYAAAASMPTVSYRDYAFTFDSEWVEGGSNVDREAEFERVVKQFARLRQDLLKETAKGESPPNACAAVRKKGGYDSSWLPLLNAPAGYANPFWTDDNLCGLISEISDY